MPILKRDMNSSFIIYIRTKLIGIISVSVFDFDGDGLLDSLVRSVNFPPVVYWGDVHGPTGKRSIFSNSNSDDDVTAIGTDNVTISVSSDYKAETLVIE